MNRRLRILLVAVTVAALLWLVLAAAERALALAQRFMQLPPWLQWTLGAAVAVFALAGLVVLWTLLRPRRRRGPVGAPSRDALNTRIGELRERGADTAALAAELAELDNRRESTRIYVAVFGEISAGKSTLIGALAPHARLASDVRGGTTRTVSHHDGSLPDGRTLCLADVPGSREHGGELREAQARDEVRRAHAVIYVCSGDLTRSQVEELRWLAAAGKPVIVAVNKADQWQDEERSAVLARVRERSAGIADDVVAVSAGGSERFRRELADGSVEQVERQRRPDIAPLLQALVRLTRPGAAALEPAREQSVLAGVHERTGQLEAEVREREAERIIARYTRRAAVGAVAAVAPGSDLVIQGALATAMARELGRLHGVAINELELDTFLKQARMTLRTSTSVVLAIAGNALKAFPGMGTLGGGALHALAYALIFDSLGRALSATLSERHALDQRDAAEQLGRLLRESGSTRLQRLATLTREALADTRELDGKGAP